MKEVIKKFDKWCEAGGPFQPHIERVVNKCFAVILAMAAVTAVQYAIAYLR